MEMIVPLIFLVIWGLSKMFGGNKDGEQGEPASSSPPVEVDRTREIQEEIRRRIAERKQAQNQQPPPTPAQTAAQRQPQSTHHQPKPTTLHPGTAQARTQAPPDDPFHQAQTEREAPTHARWEQAIPTQDDLEMQLQEQLQKMQETKAYAARTKITNDWGKSRHTKRPRASGTGPYVGNLREEVVDSLSDPRGPRKAFLYMEIFGAPVSVRREGSFVHFWEQ